jgi:hypothetical protein
MISDTSSSRTFQKIKLLHYNKLETMRTTHNTYYLCNIIEMMARNKVTGSCFNWIYPIFKLILMISTLQYEVLQLPLVLLNHLTYTEGCEQM